ncbi:hypothetical protein ANAEL_03315 [Anaerolineales bacterium]|nr:hypothetical protein ANAEL_03315 [Anaerolineales bacterium]
MKHTTFIIIAFTLLLSACGSSQPTPIATTTSAPTNTPVPTVTQTPTSAIPMIDIDGVKVPDPKVTNPELFDLKNPDSPIVQFANAFGAKPEDVVAGLHAETATSANGNMPFVVLRTSDGVSLLMAQRGVNEEWTWQEATLGGYWFAQGKEIGVFMDGNEFKHPGNQELLSTFFKEGVIGLSGQVRPNANRPPSNANGVAAYASSNNMSLFFHYVVEPGKFPADVNSTNVDSWLETRFEGIIQVLKNHKTERHPMYVVFNEAWEGNEWNEEANPLRDKYRNKWVEEYISQLLLKFTNEGLSPNKDYVIVFNDANLYNRPNKQDLVYKTLSEARLNAYNSLTADPNMAKKLIQMGVHKPEDINILLGAQTHTQLGQNIDNGTFAPAPTKDQILNLSNKFANLGGILMTEVNPFGTTEQQQQFIKDIISALKDDPNLKGIIFFNLFNPDDPEDVFSVKRLELFDNKGTPTRLFFELLR